MQLHFVFRSLLISAVVVLLSACAPAPVKESSGPSEAEKVVRERAQSRWDALVKDDLQAAYAFLSPGSREVVGFQQYVRTIRSGFWKAAKVKDVKCDSADTCNVQSEISYMYNGLPVTTPHKETWVRSGGQWWYVQN